MSFTYYQQTEALDCGAACLRMVAKYHGRQYGMEELREYIHISREGVSLAGITDGAETIGLQTLALPVTLEQLREDIPLPCIIPWGDDHFVVVYGTQGDQFLVADPDPSVGQVAYTFGEMATYWIDANRQLGQDYDTGVCLVLESTPEFRNKGREVTDKSSINHVWGYVTRYKKLLWQLISGVLAAMLLQLILPFLLKNLVDVGIVYADISFITLVIIAQGVLFLTLAIITALRRSIMLHIGTRVNVSLISDFISKLTRLPMPFLNSRMETDLLQRINDHDRVQRFLTNHSLLSVLSLANFLVFGIILALWNTTILAVFLLGTAVHLGWLFFFQRYRRQLDHRRLDQAAANQNELREIISGISDIKLYGAERQKRWAWERQQAATYRTDLKLDQIEQLQRTGAGVLNETKNLLITFLAATAVLSNTMSIGMLVAIHYILAQLNTVIFDFANLLQSYQESSISLERIDDIHRKGDEEDPEQKISSIPPFEAIRIENLEFRYNPSAPKILKGVSATIPKGKVTAIVGSSGSGKSTLLQLLVGFYEADEGQILLGSTQLGAVDLQAWRNQIGMVLQDGFIFSGSIAQNIALGDDIINDDRLIAAVRIAQIQHWIESLPMGYKTLVGETGMGISKGQQQRLLLARALYKNPEILFLDEVTTGLNAFTEVLIMDEMLDHLKGRTIVLVAQRYTTLRQADHIIVLERGEIVEQGSHHELMYARSSYYNMVQQQIELGS